MIREQAEVAILGAGFAGSLMALILRQIGRSVILIERGSLPRFAIGESSTPLANLLLESLAQTYDVPRLAPLAKYGPWQRTYPQIACGLKRGFTFFQHHPGQLFQPQAGRANELLVAASPSDDASDTHWFREHVDHFFLGEAQTAGAVYHDCTEITDVQRAASGWSLFGQREGTPVSFSASFLIDATGPAGVLSRMLGIPTSPDDLLTNSWTVFSHFTDVRPFEDVYRGAGGDVTPHPFRCDEAALHHVLLDGWMWVLRFNNGLVSAGSVWDGVCHPLESASPELLWQTVLRVYPSIAAQFERARPVRPLVKTGRLQRQAQRAAGRGWVLLPHAAYFLDPLFSAGNAHTLLGIKRLAQAIREHWDRPTLGAALEKYERALFREVAFLDRLIHGCYRAFGRFDLLMPYTMYYFAAAIHSEGRQRRGEAGEDEFLFSHDTAFRAAVWRAHTELEQLLHEPPGPGSVEFERHVARDISAFNPAGLCDPQRRNLYPFV